MSANKLKPIRIGASFARTYTFTDSSNNPIPLEGYTITFNIQNGTVLRTFDTDSGVALTSPNVITVTLTPAQTALFKSAISSASFIQLEDEYGNIDVKAQLYEKISPKALPAS